MIRLLNLFLELTLITGGKAKSGLLTQEEKELGGARSAQKVLGKSQLVTEQLYPVEWIGSNLSVASPPLHNLASVSPVNDPPRHVE